MFGKCEWSSRGAPPLPRRNVTDDADLLRSMGGYILLNGARQPGRGGIRLCWRYGDWGVREGGVIDGQQLSGCSLFLTSGVNGVKDRRRLDGNVL